MLRRIALTTPKNMLCVATALTSMIEQSRATIADSNTGLPDWSTVQRPVFEAILFEAAGTTSEYVGDNRMIGAERIDTHNAVAQEHRCYLAAAV